MTHTVRFTYIPDIIEISPMEIRAVSVELGVEGTPIEELLRDREFISLLQEFIGIRPDIATAELVPFKEEA